MLFACELNWHDWLAAQVMSASWYAHRRVGYLAASLTFTKDTDVILLTTHLFRKVRFPLLSSRSVSHSLLPIATRAQAFTQSSTNQTNAEGIQFETGSAISALANIVTPDLAEGATRHAFAHCAHVACSPDLLRCRIACAQAYCRIFTA